MSILQVLWLTGSIIAALGLSAIAACMRSSQLSDALREANRKRWEAEAENHRLRRQRAKDHTMEALREEDNDE